MAPLSKSFSADLDKWIRSFLLHWSSYLQPPGGLRLEAARVGHLGPALESEKGVRPPPGPALGPKRSHHEGRERGDFHQGAGSGSGGRGGAQNVRPWMGVKNHPTACDSW